MRTHGLLFIAGVLAAVSVAIVVGWVTVSPIWAAGVGVTAGLLWMLLCAYTVNVIQARRRGPTSDGDET